MFIELQKEMRINPIMAVFSIEVDITNSITDEKVLIINGCEYIGQWLELSPGIRKYILDYDKKVKWDLSGGLPKKM